MTDPKEPAPEGGVPQDDVARAATLERRIAELESTLNERIIRAELKAEAVRHGMIDLDGLKLIDASALKVDEAGEVRGAAAAMREFKRAKPWLFGAASTSSTAAAPPAPGAGGRRASEMSHEEWRAARAALIKQR